MPLSSSTIKISCYSIIFLFSLFLTSVNAQYDFRFQINSGFVASQQNEEIKLVLGEVEAFENAYRFGTGYSIGATYAFSGLPISLSILYKDETYVLTRYIQGEIFIENEFNELARGTYELDFEYTLIKKATISPIVFIGLNYNAMYLEREDILYRSSDFEWRYEEISARINSFGYSCGLMIKLRLSDYVGMYYKRSLEIVRQMNSKWLEPNSLYHSNYLGLYLRLSKRTNI